MSPEELAELLYETEQRIRYGHVMVPWDQRQHGAAKQHARKVAEQITMAGYSVQRPTE